MKLLRAAALATILLYSTEGVTSQVHSMDSGESFSDVFRLANNVVVAKPLDKREVYRKEIIPVPGKKDETYQEWVELFEVTAIIKPGNITAGQTIKVWKEPAYNFEMMKEYYQTGINKSPVMPQYAPMHPVKEGEEQILFLNDKEPTKAVYQYRAAEGIASRQAVETMPLKDEKHYPDNVK